MNEEREAYAELERTDGKKIRGCNTWTVPWRALGDEVTNIAEMADVDEPVNLKITARMLTAEQFGKLCEEGR